MSAIATINITQVSPYVKSDGFGVPLLVADHSAWVERLRYYSGSPSAILAAIDADGLASGSSGYDMAALCLAQSPTLAKLAIGRHDDVGDADYGVSMTAIEAADSSGWYAFTTDDDSDAEVGNCASWAESTKHIYVGATTDADDLSATGGVIAANKTALRKRSFLGHHTPAAQDYISAGILGMGLSANLDNRNGQINWSNNGIANVTEPDDDMSESQRDFCHGYYGWTSRTEMGRPTLRKVFNGFGRPVNYQVAVDWLETRLREAAASLIYNKRILGYDPQGLADCENAVRGVLQTGVNNGSVVSFNVYNEGMDAVQQADLDAGHVRVISFDAKLRVGIDTIGVNGTVST